MKKRIAALILAVLMVAATFVGCAKKVDVSKYGTTEVIKIGGQSVYLDELNYYVRTNQYEDEKNDILKNSGVTKWDQEINYYNIIIYTLKEDLLFESVAELRQVYVLSAQAAKKNITLTADEQVKVEAAAKEFLAGDEKLASYVNLTEARLVEILTRNALANKMYQDVIKNVNTEVTKEEALKYDVSYIYITKDKLAKIKDLDKDATPETVAKKIVERVNGGEKLADVLKDYKDGLEATAATMADGENGTTYGKTAEKLKVGEAGYNEGSTEGTYYLVVRDSDYNEKATETNKETIANKRLADEFKKVYTEWEKATAFDPDYKMIEKLPVSEPIYVKTSSDKTTEAADDTTGEAEQTTEVADGTTGEAEQTTEAAESTEAETK